MQLTTEFQKVLETSTKVTQNVTGYLRLYLKYGGRDEANNKDIIYYEIRQYAYNPYGNYDAWSWSGSYPFNITNEKGTLASGSYTQSAIKSDGKEKVRASGSWKQEHNPDGTWSSNISFDGYVYKTKLSTSGNITLPTIPRRTTISATDSKIGSISTIYLKINSSSFNHQLLWRYPNEDVWSIIATNVKENYQWKVPDEIYEAIPNSKSIQLTILCETYNTDGSLVGSDETTMWASVNEEVARPTLSVTIKNDGTSGTTYELTGSETAFIKDYTNAIIDANVVVRKSSYLQEYKVVNGNKSSTSQDTAINTISTGKFSFFVKDSRQLSPSTGYQTDKYVDTFIEYFAPKVLTPTIERTEQTSTEVIATLSGTYWNGNFGEVTNVGTLKYSWRSKLASSNEWGGWSSWASPTINGANFSINELSLGTNYATNSSYDFQFRFMDALSNLDSSKIVTTSTQNVTISTPIIEVYEDAVNVNGNVLKNNIELPIALNDYSTSTTDTYSCDSINNIVIDKQYYMVDNTPKQFQDCYDKWIKIGYWIATGNYHRCALTFIIQDQNTSGIFSFLCNSGSSKTDLGVSIIKIGGNHDGSRVMASYYTRGSDGYGQIDFYVKPSHYGKGAIIKLGQCATFMYRVYSNTDFSSNDKNSFTIDQIGGTKVYG